MTGAAGAEVGSGHVSIFPVMTGFRSMVSKEIQASGKEGGSIFSRAFQGVGSKAGSSLGKDMKSAFNGSAGDLASPALKKMQSEVASAARAMSAARLKQQDAAGKVRVAEAQLAAAIAKNGAESVQAVAASERLASAKRREQSTSEALTAAEGRLKDAKKAVSDVKQATIEAPKTGVFTNAIQRIRSSVQGLNRENVDAVSSKLSGFGVKWGVVAGVAGAATQRIMGLFSGMISGAMDASDSTQKFKNTLNFAGIDTETIGKLVDQTQVYADRTVYNLGDIRSATAQLASNGVKDYANLVEAAGNLNAVAGGNADTFKSVTMVLTQTAGAGKLTTENWNQLRDAIPGASGKIQDALKKNKAFTGNFSDALEKGQVSADEFNQALMDLGMTDIAKKAAADSSTFEGAMGNWEAAVEKFGSTFLDTMKPQLTGAINFASDKLGNFTNWFKRTWDSVSGLIEKKDFKGAFKKAFNVDDSTMRRLEESFSGIHEGLNTIGDALSPLKSKVTGAGSSFPTLNRGLNGFAQALDTVQPVLPAIAKLLDLFGELPTGVQSAVLGFALFGRQTSMILTPIGMVVKASAGLVKGIGSVGSAISGMVSGRLSKASSISSIAESLESAGSSASTAAPKIGNAAASVEKLDTKAAGAVKKTGGLSSALGGISPASVAFGVAGIGISLVLAGIADDAEKSGDTIEDFTAAVKEGGSATESFFSKLKSGAEGKLGFWDKFNSGQGAFTDGTLAQAAKNAGISFDTVQQAISGSSSAMQALNDKTGNLWNQMSSSGSAAKIVRDEVNGLRDAYKNTIDQMIEYSKTQDSITAGFGSASAKFSELSTTLKANGDNLQNNSQLSQQSSQYMQSAASSALEAAKAQVVYGKANGDTAGSVQEAKNQIQSMRDQLVGTLTQYGMSEDAANKYADALGLIPGNVNTDAFLQTDVASSDLTAYLDRLQATPEQKQTVMNALTAQADGNVDNLHLKISDLPTWVNSVLTADNTDAQKKTAEATTSLRHFDGSKANASLNADNSDVKNKASEARGSIKSVPEEHKTNFFAEQAGSGWTNIKNFFGSFGSTMTSYWGLSHGGEVHRANGGIVQRLASGGPSGYVSGPGTSTSDSIMTWLSDGEYVIRAAAARKIGLQNLNRANATGKLSGGTVISSQPVVNQNISITNKGVVNPYVNGNILGRTAASSARNSLMGV
jgi:tape measure domain-containing protein